jgi:hypothetical protein
MIDLTEIEKIIPRQWSISEDVFHDAWVSVFEQLSRAVCLQFGWHLLQYTLDKLETSPARGRLLPYISRLNHIMIQGNHRNEFIYVDDDDTDSDFEEPGYNRFFTAILDLWDAVIAEDDRQAKDYVVSSVFRCVGTVTSQVWYGAHPDYWAVWQREVSEDMKNLDSTDYIRSDEFMEAARAHGNSIEMEMLERQEWTHALNVLRRFIENAP